MAEHCDWEGPHHCECHKETNRLRDLLHHARVRIRFMNGLVLSREQAIRSNAKLSGAAYIRASKSEKKPECDYLACPCQTGGLCHKLTIPVQPLPPRCDKRETGRFLRCDGFAGHPGAHHNKNAVWSDYPEGQ